MNKIKTKYVIPFFKEYVWIPFIIMNLAISGLCYLCEIGFLSGVFCIILSFFFLVNYVVLKY